jgi:hypothetical protein
MLSGQGAVVKDGAKIDPDVTGGEPVLEQRPTRERSHPRCERRRVNLDASRKLVMLCRCVTPARASAQPPDLKLVRQISCPNTLLMRCARTSTAVKATLDSTHLAP